MNYRKTFEAVFGNKRVGPFLNEEECRTAAKELFHTKEYVVLNWYITDIADPVSTEPNVIDVNEEETHG